MADSLKEKGNVQQALVHYFAALRKAEANSIEWEIAITTEKLGDLHEKYYRYQESIPFLKRAYSIRKMTDSVARLAEVTNSLAWNFIKIDWQDSALLYAEEAVSL